MRRQISPEKVELGMYVREFGGSWFRHPFWRARFVLRTAEDVALVRQSGVPYVIIDDELGIGVQPVQIPPRTMVSARPDKLMRRPSAQNRWEADDKSRERFERQRAKAVVAQATKVLRAVFEDVRLGRAVRMAEVNTVVDDLVESVERSPRTLLSVLQLKKKDEYTYAHSVAVCSLMVNAAMHMGKNVSEAREFGIAGLLHDLGKMGIPDAILNKAGKLTHAEYQAVKDHPEYGFQLLSQSSDIPEMALDVCRHHHEKMDGSGYPFGLSEDGISPVARLGAICDVYDALTSERVYKGASPPVEAVSAMLSWPGHFDPQLLFIFMQSVGVFPPGMLVRLRSNRLGLVLENRRRQTRPRLCVFYDMRERAFITPEEIVIRDDLVNDSIVARERPEDWGFDDWDGLVADLRAGKFWRLAS